MKIPVRVHPIIREFVIDSSGNDTITPRKGDLVWASIVHNLETCPVNVSEPLDSQNYIYIELLDCHSSSNYSASKGKFIHVNTLFRWYLSPTGEKKVNNILRKNFKTVMHSFIQGALACNPHLQQREAMEEFCNIHNITLDKITPDMIKKSWDRSDFKKKIYDNTVCTNSIFF